MFCCVNSQSNMEHLLEASRWHCNTETKTIIGLKEAGKYMYAYHNYETSSLHFL